MRALQELDRSLTVILRLICLMIVLMVVLIAAKFIVLRFGWLTIIASVVAATFWDLLGCRFVAFQLEYPRLPEEESHNTTT